WRAPPDASRRCCPPPRPAPARLSPLPAGQALCRLHSHPHRPSPGPARTATPTRSPRDRCLGCTPVLHGSRFSRTRTPVPASIPWAGSSPLSRRLPSFLSTFCSTACARSALCTTAVHMPITRRGVSVLSIRHSPSGLLIVKQSSIFFLLRGPSAMYMFFPRSPRSYARAMLIRISTRTHTPCRSVSPSPSPFRLSPSDSRLPT
ncbi:hypothetical protein GGX14DRAFT_635708, partial [Mycena pura]